MKIALLGDIAFFGRASKDGNAEWETYFKDIACLLDTMDYVVGNLETPFSEKRKSWGAKSAYLCSSPQNVDILKMLHVDAVTLANNHMYDYGDEAFVLTQTLLDEAGIAWYGVNGKELLIEKNGNKIAFTGFCCYSTNPLKCVEYGHYGINEFDMKNAEKILAKHRKAGYFNIVAVHAGIEHVNYPSLETIAVAKKLKQTGPLIYYGHHPHVAQPVMQQDDSIIAYSLGNFCFDDTYTKISGDKPLVKLSEDNRKSFVLVVSIENNVICGFNVVPIYIGTDKIHLGRGMDMQQLSLLQRKMESTKFEEYEQMRSEQRKAWLKPRRAARDAKWVLKRIRPRYFLLMLTNRLNTWKYDKHVSRYLRNNQ